MSKAEDMDAIALVLHVSKLLNALGSTKYCALSFFADRFLPWLRSNVDEGSAIKLQITILIRKKTLQFIGLIFIWIASKIHETKPIRVSTLRQVANELIPDVHFSIKDFAPTEILLMQAIKFDLGTGTLVSDVATNYLRKLRMTAKVEKFVNLQTVLNTIDLIYGVANFNFGIISPGLAAASVLATAYVISIPEEKCNFPLLSWLSTVSGTSVEEIESMTRKILTVIFF